jgi:hypothetical protein
MIRNTSIGFEYQMNQLNVCEKQAYTNNIGVSYVTYYPTKVIFDIRSTLQVYGDRSQDEFVRSNHALHKRLAKQEILTLVITDSKKERLDLLVDEDFQEFFNEAEFLVTYATPDPTSIPLTEKGVLDWIFSNVRRSTQELRDYFTTLKKRSIVSVLGYTKQHGYRQRRHKEIRSEFPYSQVYIDPDHDNFVFFGRFDIPIDRWSLRYQTTIGLELKDVLPVLRILQTAYEKSPKKDPEYSRTAIRALSESEKEVRAILSPEQNSVVYAVACLLRYMSKTSRIRKHSLFVIRHYQRDLISVLTPEELDFLSSLDQQFSVPRKNRQQYQRIVRQTEDKSVRNSSISHLNQLQRMAQTGTFHVQSRREQTRILVEIRMIEVLGVDRMGKRKRTVPQLQRELDEFCPSVSQVLAKKIRVST